jgi:hypothetical protein
MVLVPWFRCMMMSSPHRHRAAGGEAHRGGSCSTAMHFSRNFRSASLSSARTPSTPGSARSVNRNVGRSSAFGGSLCRSGRRGDAADAQRQRTGPEHFHGLVGIEPSCSHGRSRRPRCRSWSRLARRRGEDACVPRCVRYMRTLHRSFLAGVNAPPASFFSGGVRCVGPRHHAAGPKPLAANSHWFGEDAELAPSIDGANAAIQAARDAARRFE